MARMKSIATIDSEIAAAQEELMKIQARYDKAAAKLEELQEQKRQYEAKQIREAYAKSGKSFDEIMTFLNP